MILPFTSWYLKPTNKGLIENNFYLNILNITLIFNKKVGNRVGKKS